MKKVSVIVPVYNSEKVLERCISSILAQTYNNIEIILVNDGSTDNSGDICNSYSKKNKRICVIHQENMGVSAARNSGILHAAGDYVQFVDSDDYIDRNMTETLVNALEKSSASVVICGYKLIDLLNGNIYYVAPKKVGFYKLEQFLGILDYLFPTWLNSPCNKMYTARILRDYSIMYPEEIDLGEDLLFNLNVIRRSSRFQVIPDCLYNYVKYGNNTLTSKPRKNRYDIEKMLFEKLMSLYKDRDYYANQIDNLERYYSSKILDCILYTANSHDWKEYKSFCNKARIIKADEILKKRFNSIEVFSLQDKLVKYLTGKNMFFLIFMFSKMKLLIKDKMPNIFKFLKNKFGAKKKDLFRDKLGLSVENDETRCYS